MDLAVPSPLLFNCWKHHAGALRQRIAAVTTAADLPPLAEQLLVIGTDLMDLYHGTLSPTEIAASIVRNLETDGHLEPERFAAWLEAHGGFAVVPVAADSSRWVLRQAPPPRYAHLHPARYSPLTCRVRAPVLKTAIMALAYARVHGGTPGALDVLNAARQTYLGLPPLGRDSAGHRGIDTVLSLLAA
jgi:hypothetical protein